MEVGIVGLPVSGKTTLFATLTGQTAQAHQQRGGKLEVHRGIVKVPDERLDKLTEIYQPKKKVPATIEYIEVGGMDRETAQTSGFDPQFLQVLKNTDALCVVIGAFANEYHPHPSGSIDIQRDIQTVESEFLLSDLSIVENRLERLKKQVMKSKEEHLQQELDLLTRCQSCLEEEKPLREMVFREEEDLMLSGFQFLSAKPVVWVININEADICNQAEIIARVEKKTNTAKVALSAKVEEEISELEDDDRKLFLEDLGIEEPALHKLIHTSFDLLGLISFFTVGNEECHAWTIKKGTTALKAAGTVHTDFERGFIRAEVVNFDEYIQFKSMAKCREQGILRVEGKSYIVQDGDILTIRFNV